jgi:hypothetical protein
MKSSLDYLISSKYTSTIRFSLLNYLVKSSISSIRKILTSEISRKRKKILVNDAIVSIRDYKAISLTKISEVISLILKRNKILELRKILKYASMKNIFFY